jgi:YaiO family outer membrane protein
MLTRYLRILAAVTVVTFLRATPVFAQLTIFGGLEYEHFARDLSPWKQATLEMSAKSERGTIAGRVTEARRFDTRGSQVEVDAYPRFSKSTYAYFNAGASNSAIFAHRKYAAEVFHAFPGAWEGSAGARRVEFSSTTTIYTASIGRYWGNYWAAFRPYVADDRAGTRKSASFVMRRYFATGDDYIGFDALTGQTARDPLVARELGLARWSAGVQAQHLAGGILLRGRIGIESIDLGSGASRRGTIATAGIGRRF